jgi:ABC-type transport system involved in multi-copper enzyme maturation permease subunit
MEKSIKKMLFDNWVMENHPLFYPIYAILVILSIIAVLGSILLVVFDVEWWWKSAIVSGMALFIIVWVGKTILLNYVDKFNRR